MTPQLRYALGGMSENDRRALLVELGYLEP